MKEALYFKVKIGFGPDDYISITPDELPKALKAQASGQVALFAEGSVAGNTILAITPDWCRTMGWNRDHKLNGEDYRVIGEHRVETARNVLENAKIRVLGGDPQDARIAGPAEHMVDQLAAGFKHHHDDRQ